MQRAFEANGDFRRDFSFTSALFMKRGIDLRREIFDRMRFRSEEVAGGEGMTKGDNQVVVLDGGCAPGISIEHVVRGFNLTASHMNLSCRVHGIGVDLNPVGDIPPDILSIGVDRGFGTDPVAELREGDVCNLPVSDASVDVYYCGNTVIYVADSLKAFEEGYRVLKPDGIAVWHVLERDISFGLKFSDVLGVTPGALGVFSYVESPCGEYGFVICRKPASDEFKGFPFEMCGELKFEDLNGGKPTMPHEIARYYRSAVYRAKRG